MKYPLSGRCATTIGGAVGGSGVRSNQRPLTRRFKVANLIHGRGKERKRVNGHRVQVGGEGTQQDDFAANCGRWAAAAATSLGHTTVKGVVC
jgi:hypothetical protein